MDKPTEVEKLLISGMNALLNGDLTNEQREDVEQTFREYKDKISSGFRAWLINKGVPISLVCDLPLN